MHHAFAILLLFLLPMQWGYASVAEYCRHESSTAAQAHLGHHAHQHADASADTGKDKSDGFNDADCPTCHLSCVGAVLMEASTSAPNPADSPQFALHQSCPQRSPDNPFRPPLAAGL